MPINFPSLPTLGDSYTYGGKTYRYGGVYWSAINIADQGYVLKNTFQSPVVAADYRQTLVTISQASVSNTNGVLLNYI